MMQAALLSYSYKQLLKSASSTLATLSFFPSPSTYDNCEQ